MTHRTDGYVAVSTDIDDNPHFSSAEFIQGSSNDGITRPMSHGGTLTILPGGRGYTYSYGPRGLAGLLHNPYTLGCAIFASIGGLNFGYDQGVIANVLVMKDFTSRWPIGAWEKGLMTAMLDLGALAGALLAGTLADRYSRRYSIFVACVIFCIGSALQCGARSIHDLILGRAIGGVGIGSLSMLSPLYMAEISPPEARGSLMALEQFAIVVGVVFGFWTGFFTRSLPGAMSWRIPLGVQIIPGICLGVGCLYLSPSPRLLIMQGKTEEAFRVLARLRLRDPDEDQVDPLLQIELLEMQVEANMIRHAASASKLLEPSKKENRLVSEARAWGRLFHRDLVDRTMIGVFIMFFQQWSGINALLYYGPSLMHSLGLQGDTVELIGSGVVGIIQFIAVVPAILYIDRIGRKPLLQGGAIVMGLAHFFIAVLIWLYQDNWPSHYVGAWTAVGLVYVFTAAYGLSYGPVAWVLPSEVCPLSVRSKGVAIATASNWINNFFIGLVTPVLLAISPVATMLIFSLACFAASVWSRYYVPETANVSLEDIDRLFRSDVARADADRKAEIAKQVGLEDLMRELAVDGATVCRVSL